jgi:hypothetical protein
MIDFEQQRNVIIMQRPLKLLIESQVYDNWAYEFASDDSQWRLVTKLVDQKSYDLLVIDDSIALLQ